jgi:hypothetical protein
MTKLTSELCKNEGVLWCTKARSWIWDKLCLANVPLSSTSTNLQSNHLQLSDAPPEVEVYFHLPTGLSANLAAVKPLRCDRCKLWFCDYPRLAEHTSAFTKQIWDRMAAAQKKEHS